jgi:vacuolar-type H+-ATPase subunit I/STV1
MTTTEILWAIGFAAYGAIMLIIGIWLAVRFANANQRLTDRIARFHRDCDVNDVADMETDSGR